MIELINQVGSDAIQIGNIKYGIIFFITSAILTLCLHIVVQLVREFKLDLEAKATTVVVVLILTAVPLYFWVDSLTNLIHINCYPNHYVFKELGSFK